jgi:hypothetical protein
MQLDILHGFIGERVVMPSWSNLVCGWCNLLGGPGTARIHMNNDQPISNGAGLQNLSNSPVNLEMSSMRMERWPTFLECLRHLGSVCSLLCAINSAIFRSSPRLAGIQANPMPSYHGWMSKRTEGISV